MDAYDFFECVIYDIHCVPRGRILTKKRLMGALKKGIGLFAGACYYSIRESTPTCNDYFFPDGNFGNGRLVPIPDTIVKVPSALSGDHRVGHILCDMVHQDDTVEPTTPRTLALRQLQKLESLGFKIKSAFEIEFVILDKTNQPWGHYCKWAQMDVINENQEILLGVIKELKTSGVMLDSVEAEAGPGNYEVTTEIAWGIKSPDMTIRFKSMSLPLLKKHGLRPTFMTNIEKDRVSNGFHFNLSICDRNGSNAFFDASQPNKLSEIGQHWLAGLIKHAPAITAMMCPTVNCYRRLHDDLCPTKSNYGTNKRNKAFRLVTEREGNVYIEARIPSSACNPYFVMAGIVAAGIDGITNQLSLKDSDQERELPRDLGSALEMMKDDAYIVEALGWEFVEQYYTNKMLEIDHFNGLGDCSDNEQFQRELDLYLTRV